ncbi:MAG: GFA family protein [Gammaproteobacteria bacterium]|nr:GFA family protein [Gammaproteobacteria bacterium]
MTLPSQEGGCLCGAVRYRTTDQPKRVIACHCTTCKQRTGAAYGVGVYLDDNDVEFIKGSTQTFELRSDESDRWIRNEFCTSCGTTVSWTLELRPGLRAIAGGTYDDPNWFDIQAHIWTRSARDDMCYSDHVAVFEKALPLA